MCFIDADAPLILKHTPTLTTEVKYFSDFSLNKLTLSYVSGFVCVVSTGEAQMCERKTDYAFEVSVRPICI